VKSFGIMAVPTVLALTFLFGCVEVNGNFEADFIA
jgi:hypothetical protein